MTHLLHRVGVVGLK